MDTKSKKVSLSDRIKFRLGKVSAEESEKISKVIAKENEKKLRDNALNNIIKTRKSDCSALTKRMNNWSEKMMWSDITKNNELYATTCNGESKYDGDIIKTTPGKTLCESYKDAVENTYNNIKKTCRNFDEIKLGTYKDDKGKMHYKNVSKKKCVQENINTMAKKIPFKLDDPERDAGIVFHAVCDSIPDKKYNDVDFQESWHILADDHKKL